MPKTFDTSQFELSHGKRPRGYGSWAFADADVFYLKRGDLADSDITWAKGTLTEAKKQLPAGDYVVLP